jgi:hypothetical protein
VRGAVRKGKGGNEGTSLEWFCAAAVVAAGSTLFGHFEEGTPKARRLSRWAAYLGVVALLSKTAGRPWTFAYIFGLPAVGAIFHVWWCLRHGINPLTAEPKEEYYRLRGWTS